MSALVTLCSPWRQLWRLPRRLELVIQTFDERTSTRHIRATCLLFDDSRRPLNLAITNIPDYATIILSNRFHRSHVRSPWTKHFASPAGECSEGERGRILCECEHPGSIAIALRMLIQAKRLASSKLSAVLCMRPPANSYPPASPTPTLATMIPTTPPLVTCTEPCRGQQFSDLSSTSPKQTLESSSDRISTAARSNTAQSHTSLTTC
jgi:hypothetical protein